MTGCALCIERELNITCTLAVHSHFFDRNYSHQGLFRGGQTRLCNKLPLTQNLWATAEPHRCNQCLQVSDFFRRAIRNHFQISRSFRFFHDRGFPFSADLLHLRVVLVPRFHHGLIHERVVVRCRICLVSVVVVLIPGQIPILQLGTAWYSRGDLFVCSIRKILISEEEGFHVRFTEIYLLKIKICGASQTTINYNSFHWGWMVTQHRGS